MNHDFRINNVTFNIFNSFMKSLLCYAFLLAIKERNNGMRIERY